MVIIYLHSGFLRRPCVGLDARLTSGTSLLVVRICRQVACKYSRVNKVSQKTLVQTHFDLNFFLIDSVAFKSKPVNKTICQKKPHDVRNCYSMLSIYIACVRLTSQQIPF